MIEAAAYATPYQRKLYHHYQQVHRRLNPPPIVHIEPPPVEAPPPPPLVPPPPAPTKQVGIDRTMERMKIIRRVVCQAFCIDRLQLQNQRRTPTVVIPRHVYCYLAQRLTMASYPVIGRSLGGRDHTTIISAIRRLHKKMHASPELKQRVEAIEAKVKEEFGINAQPYRCIGKYVVHERVSDYMLLGWMWAANLNEYAALMIWPCGCECVEPR